MRITRVACRCLLAVAVGCLLGATTQVYAEEVVDPASTLFDESAPVADQTLAEARGAGLIAVHPPSRGDVAVILWDEQPKVKPAASTATGTGNGSPTARATVVVR
jgi:hypothetical protein